MSEKSHRGRSCWGDFSEINNKYTHLFYKKQHTFGNDILKKQNLLNDFKKAFFRT